MFFVQHVDFPIDFTFHVIQTIYSAFTVGLVDPPMPWMWHLDIYQHLQGIAVKLRTALPAPSLQNAQAPLQRCLAERVQDTGRVGWNMESWGVGVGTQLLFPQVDSWNHLAYSNRYSATTLESTTCGLAPAKWMILLRWKLEPRRVSKLLLFYSIIIFRFKRTFDVLVYRLKSSNIAWIL